MSVYDSTVLTDAPFIFYRLGDVTSTMFDDSGGGWNGTFSGSGYTQGQASLVGDGEGSVLWSGGYASAAPTVLLGGAGGISDFTLECWMKMPSGGASFQIFFGNWSAAGCGLDVFNG